MITSRQLRHQLRKIWVEGFHAGQRLGVDILPRHYYSSIPDVRELKQSRSWREPTTMVAVRGAAITPQLEFARMLTASWRGHLGGQAYRKAIAHNGVVGYGEIEAEFLFCFIATLRPGKIIQIGAGVSTAVIAEAAVVSGYRPHVLAIDPFPNAYLRDAARREEVELLSATAQDVALEVLTDLGPGDLLFVDSSHAVRAGGEVNRVILEVLPRLRSGCHVHFHDIDFPYDYGPDLLRTCVFWSESTLLHAFLTQNSRWRITASLSMLAHLAQAELREMFPSYRPAIMDHGLIQPSPAGSHFPNSAWLLAEDAECVGPVS